jgi:hypothetical protein
MPNYNLDKIKFSIDEPTWEKAADLYEKGKVKNFEEFGFEFNAVVSGASDYNVQVSAKNYNAGHCNCYLGQNETLCKHMVAVAIMAVIGGRKLTAEEKNINNEVKCSGKTGELSTIDIEAVKKEISESLQYIKPYNGPSKKWFEYQDSLTEGCNRLAKILSNVPVSLQTAKLSVDLLLRLDKKLCTGGVDDSDGTVGGFIEEVVKMLLEYTELDHSCVKSFTQLNDRETCFGWEEPLLEFKQ